MGGIWLCISFDHGIPWDCRVAYGRHMGGIWEELGSHGMSWEAVWNRVCSESGGRPGSHPDLPKEASTEICHPLGGKWVAVWGAGVLTFLSRPATACMLTHLRRFFSTSVLA